MERDCGSARGGRENVQELSRLQAPGSAWHLALRLVGSVDADWELEGEEQPCCPRLCVRRSPACCQWEEGPCVCRERRRCDTVLHRRRAGRFVARGSFHATACGVRHFALPRGSRWVVSGRTSSTLLLRAGRTGVSHEDEGGPL